MTSTPVVGPAPENLTSQVEGGLSLAEHEGHLGELDVLARPRVGLPGKGRIGQRVFASPPGDGPGGIDLLDGCRASDEDGSIAGEDGEFPPRRLVQCADEFEELRIDEARADVPALEGLLPAGRDLGDACVVGNQRLIGAIAVVDENLPVGGCLIQISMMLSRVVGRPETG